VARCPVTPARVFGFAKEEQMRLNCLQCWTTVVATIFFAANAAAQISNNSQPRITQAIDNRQRMTLLGNVHPKALAAALAGNDLGRVTPSLDMPDITLGLAPSASQQAD